MLDAVGLNGVEYALILVYGMIMLFIFVYSLVQLHLLVRYLKKAPSTRIQAPTEWPCVTVQLPIFNERYVVERLIEAIVALDYPKEKLEIQVLDDSDDETVDLAQASVLKWSSHGFDIVYLNRSSRVGFKAGALACGLERAKGDFIAIFDADFIPEPDFLKSVMPQFSNTRVGLVQTRWGHLNRDFNVLTQLQAFGLDAHFSIEQVGRSEAQSFINFNGTAGVWRKNAIVEAGGWSSDTLTEDLDLSYRAQLIGWRFVYLEEVCAPAELPITMTALKTQQFRWTKGAAECAVKNLGKLWRSENVSLRAKLHGHFHLLNSSIFIAVLLIAVLSIPLLIVKSRMSSTLLIDGFAAIFSVSIAVLSVFYFVSYKSNNENFKFIQFVRKFIAFLSMSMGMSLHNSIAVIEGYFGRKTPFIRTPKFNVQPDQTSWRMNVYARNSSALLTAAEALLSEVFALAILLGIYLEDYGLIPFHAMLSAGFGIVAFYSVKHDIR